ncbi:hypothetical protein [Mycobacterium gastri]|uniref:hypothetical protein n=1 Tax=Mycobacterium gastri TaxID=1777 RepID=UPI001FC92BDB|nr:hypothetical protein [Mycobacterium gastri]
MQVDTNGSDKALARVTLTNSAAMLENSSADPALNAKYRDAAHALADAYRTTTVMSSVGTEAEWRVALDDGNAKNAVMKRLCDGG